MGLAVKPATPSDGSSDELTESWLESIIDILEMLGFTVMSGGSGRGTLSYINLATDAAIRQAQVADGAVVKTNTVDPGTQTITKPTVFGPGSALTTSEGTGTAAPVVGGVLHVNVTPVGNVGAGEDNLMSYTLPANTLVAAGRGVRVTAWGSTANNANAKRLRFYWGGVLLYGPDFLVNSTTHWKVEILILRTGLNTQVYMATAVGDNVQETTYDKGAYSGATATETVTNAIAFTAEATANNDIIQGGLLVEAL